MGSRLASSSWVAKGHEPGANGQSGLFYAGERDMAGVVWWWAGEAREAEVPGAGDGSSRCCEGCEGCGRRPEPVAAGYESRCASEANLHGKWAP